MSCKSFQSRVPSSGGAAQVPVVPSTSAGSHTATASKGGATESSLQLCKGCPWSGKSLRGHLARTNSGCQQYYDMDALAKEAQRLKKQQEAQWETNHRKERTEAKEQQRQNQRDSPRKRPAPPTSAQFSGSPRKQPPSQPASKPSTPINQTGSTTLQKALECPM